MRRDDICLYLAPGDRVRLQALVADRNTPRKLVWRAEIVLATADGHGTNEIMRRSATSKPTVWRWQERYLDAGLEGLQRDKTRPSRVPPLPRERRLKVIAKTVQEKPANATHWSRALMAEAVGISPSSVGAYLVRGGVEAASDARVQGVERPAVRGEIHRYRRALPRSAGAGGGAVCG